MTASEHVDALRSARSASQSVDAGVPVAGLPDAYSIAETQNRWEDERAIILHQHCQQLKVGNELGIDVRCHASAGARTSLTYRNAATASGTDALVIPAYGRGTVWANGTTGGQDFRTEVVSTRAITAERALYWPTGVADERDDYGYHNGIAGGINMAEWDPVAQKPRSVVLPPVVEGASSAEGPQQGSPSGGAGDGTASGGGPAPKPKPTTKAFPWSPHIGMPPLMVTEDEWGPLQEQQWDIVQSFFLWELGGAMLQGWSAGSELAFGKSFRLATFGNRTGHPTGRWPHYHRLRSFLRETGHDAAHADLRSLIAEAKNVSGL